MKNVTQETEGNKGNNIKTYLKISRMWHSILLSLRYSPMEHCCFWCYTWGLHGNEDSSCCLL